MKILIIPLSTITDSSSRYRGYYLKNELKKKEIFAEIIPSMKFQKNNFKSHISKIFQYFKIIKKILKFSNNDILIIHRYIFYPFPLKFLEIIKLLRKFKIIFDLDDAIYLLYPKHIKHLIKLANIITVGSHAIFNHIKKYHKSVILIPTSVKFENYPKKIHNQNSIPIIGWIGSTSTEKYLSVILNPLLKLSKNYSFKFKIISSNSGIKTKNIFQEKGILTKFSEWSLESEMNDLLEFDIGVMPLYKDEWAKAKCSFKAIQYMAAGIPTICSDIGENRYLINHGRNGFLAKNQNNWFEYFEELINNVSLRKKIGNAARKTIKEKYSLSSNINIYIKLINNINKY